MLTISSIVSRRSRLNPQERPNTKLRELKINSVIRALSWGVYTDAAYRGQGIAHKIMTVALEVIKRNMKIMVLNLGVNSTNTAAKALYASLGFNTYGQQRYCMLLNDEFHHEDMMELYLPSLEMHQAKFGC